MRKLVLFLVLVVSLLSCKKTETQTPTPPNPLKDVIDKLAGTYHGDIVHYYPHSSYTDTIHDTILVFTNYYDTALKTGIYVLNFKGDLDTKDYYFEDRKEECIDYFAEFDSTFSKLNSYWIDYCGRPIGVFSGAK